MDRVRIGDNFLHQANWKIILGVPLIYLPIILTVPFAALCVLVVKAHLKLIGAENLRSYWSFVPDWESHRYRLENQITYSTGAKWHNLRGYRRYWIFNCKLYCPLSVALFRYLSYLVMVVENWWCPFNHDKKAEYSDGAIDKSYWHLHSVDKMRLHPEDRDNPIWSEEVEKH